MNGLEAESLGEAQEINASGERRNVGLVVETRPDHINKDELRWFRYLGVTKVQIGVQSLDDEILNLNHRGESVADIKKAIRLLRLGGFKIHAHWMPNLLGATPESDLADFQRLWSDPAVRPDELKIYPCMLLENAELYEYWKRDEYQPYSEEVIIDLLIACKIQIPRYVRINRIIRDIPTTNVIEGIKRANLRQVVQDEMRVRGLKCGCIRCREVRRQEIMPDDLLAKSEVYETEDTIEHFLSFETQEKIAGFLRLSLPKAGIKAPVEEVQNIAMIREVHIYGPAVRIGDPSNGEAQHSGLGGRLIERAKEIAREAGFEGIAVISAIGTREYYAAHGFQMGELYMRAEL
jgi:elongator complex protein 3